VDPNIEEMAKKALLHARALSRGEGAEACRVCASVRWGETAMTHEKTTKTSNK
jgi:hypothetical protein